MNASISGHFLGPRGSKTFVLLRRPSGRPSGRTVLVVPPFAEEMNKARRLVADTAEQLVAGGTAVLQPDFFGTGDSDGEFREATLDRWLADLGATCQWSAQQGFAVSAALAVRLGCAIVSRAVTEQVLPHVDRSVFWQPVLDGNKFLKQFLRLRVAASMMAEDRKESVREIRSRISDGETVEVAGYPLTDRMCAGLEELVVERMPAELGDVTWIELTSDDVTLATPPTTPSILDSYRMRGGGASIRRLQGAPFWTSIETVRNPDLANATMDALS